MEERGGKSTMLTVEVTMRRWLISCLQNSRVEFRLSRRRIGRKECLPACLPGLWRPFSGLARQHAPWWARVVCGFWVNCKQL